ncbi:Innexin shaking-B [Trachymyrmex zeteki]|uniref:Innexin n=1 Tax=Mycetomoellerius zeteki TaxID=64791 RepID=A0A151X089_9HYME|nr:Innexin shaking-B [Trachymyrmex zeteki]
MIDLFGSIRSLFKVHRIAEDSMIFRLHYRATVAVLLAGCLTLACKSISGSPIHCEATAAVDKAVLETFCWLHTTYSMVRAFNMSIGQAVPYPGVSNTKGEGGHGHAPHPLVKQHKYYQWVIFFLLLQLFGEGAEIKPATRIVRDPNNLSRRNRFLRASHTLPAVYSQKRITIHEYLRRRLIKTTPTVIYLLH